MKNLKNYFTALVLILVAVMMNNCDFYVSEVPISNSKKSKIDTSVIGSWGYFKNDTLRSAMKVSPLNERELMVNFIVLDNPKELSMYQNYVVHNTEIKDTNYVNARVLEGNEKDKYFFFTYELSNDSLALYVLDKKKFTKIFNSSDSLYKTIRHHNEEFSGFFRPVFDEKFIRIKTY